MNQMEDTLTEDTEFENRKDKIADVNEGKFSPVIVGAAVLMGVGAAVLPVNQSGFTSIMWVWLVCVLGLLTFSVLLPETTKNGLLVKRISLVAFLLFLILFPIGKGGATMTDFGLFAVFGAVVVGMNLTQGFAGQVSLAPAAFLGIGSYTSVLLNFGEEIGFAGITIDLPETPFLLTIPVAMAVCMLLSVLIGFPALRVRGPWLAFVTLAFSLLVFLVMNNENDLTRGSRGIRVLRTDFSILGIDMLPTQNFYFVGLIYLFFSLTVVWWMVRSPWGRAFKAIRDNADRASSLGVNVRHYTLIGFAVGSGLAGGAGAIYARQIEYIEPRSYFVNQTIDFFLATVAGGLGTLAGPLIGSSLITIVADYLRFTGDWYRVWFGLFVMVMMLIAPEGIAGSFNKFKAWVQKRQGSAK